MVRTVQRAEMVSPHRRELFISPRTHVVDLPEHFTQHSWVMPTTSMASYSGSRRRSCDCCVQRYQVEKSRIVSHNMDTCRLPFTSAGQRYFLQVGESGLCDGLKLVTVGLEPVGSERSSSNILL